MAIVAAVENIPSDPSTPSSPLPGEAEPVSAVDACDGGAAQASEQPGNGGGDAGASTPEDETETLRAEVSRLKDQLLRLAADFDNFRKRSRRELADGERAARGDLLRELLPVFDNLERAGQHAGTSTDVQSMAEGIAMVEKLFLDTLGRVGIERIASLGQAFDPNLHEAIQQMETTEYPAGSVAAEVLPGYRMGERLVRPAMVVVAKPPSGS